MEEPFKGLNDCLRMLLACFRKKMSVLHLCHISLLSLNRGTLSSST